MSPSQKELALAYSSKLNAQDFDGLASLLSEDFTHEFRPATLGGMGMPFRNKAQFIAHVKEVSHKVVDFNLQTPYEIIEAKDAVIMHIAADGKTASGSPYNNEYLFIFRFDGGKIVGIKEFMDSKYVSDAFGTIPGH